MAIADTITSMQNHTSNAYDMLSNGTDLTGINKNLENLSSTIFEAFLEALRNPDTLFTNLPKTSASGSNITLNNTANAPMRITLNPTAITQDGTPTPSSPQDIHTISGNNSVVVEGKNIFNGSLVYQDQTLNGVTLKNNGDGSFTITGTATANTTFNTNEISNADLTTKAIKLPAGTYTQSFATRLQLYDANGNWVTNTWGTFTTTQETYVKNAFITLTSGQTYNSTFYYQIEKGNTKTSYEPYVSQTNPINLGEYELGTIGDYKNRIFKNIPTDEDYSSEREEGAWYYKQGIGKVVLDGSESWTLTSTANVFWTTNNDYNTNAIPICNRYVGIEPIYGASVLGDFQIAFNNNKPSYPRLYIKNSNCANETALTTELSNNNAIVYYPLATPTYTKITGELANQLEQVYKGMLSYDGTTNISQVNNDLAFELVGSAITK